MTLLLDAFEEKKMDVRLLDRHLNNATITQKQADTYLQSLSDDADSALWVDISKFSRDEFKDESTS